MNNNAEKEQWIEAALGSTKGGSPAKPSADFYKGIAAKLAGAKPAEKSIPFPVKRWVAAAVLLLAVNIGSVVYFASQHRAPDTFNNGDAVTNAMQLESTYNY